MSTGNRPPSSAVPRVLQVAIVLVVGVAVVVYAGYVAVRRPEPPGVTSAAPSTPPSTRPASPEPKRRTVALWVGDSYTAGVADVGSREGYPCQTSKIMRWSCHVDAQEATGFVSDGSRVDINFGPVISRLEGDKQQYAADVVVIDAGREDGAEPGELRANVKRYVNRVATTYPQARIVMVVPFAVGTVPGFAGPDVFAPIAREQMKRVDGCVLDPSNEGWATPDRLQRFVAADGVHPDRAGHKYIARHLVGDLRKVCGL